eukprot:1158696-Pelagomonas_calceolata.AAC.1
MGSCQYVTNASRFGCSCHMSHVQAFEEEKPEQTVDPLDDEMDLENLVNQGFEGNPQGLSDFSWLSTTGCAIRKDVTFDFQPANPQTDIMPTWQ